MEKNLVWISGGSTGIGKATAKKFIYEGWNVAVTARNLEELKKLKSEIENTNNINKLYIFQCDIKDIEQVKNIVKKIEEIGPINLTILNAGTTHPYTEEFNINYYNHVVETNISGTLNCISSIYPFYKKRREGHLSIVSSMVGYRGLPTASAYTMTKAALINLAESLYFDFRKIGVRVSLINPGFIKTRLTDKNNFPMPFLKSSDYAANIIYKGLMNKKKFEIIFPLPWFIIMKLARLLPYKIYFYLVSKITKL